VIPPICPFPFGWCESRAFDNTTRDLYLAVQCLNMVINDDIRSRSYGLNVDPHKQLTTTDAFISLFLSVLFMRTFDDNMFL